MAGNCDVDKEIITINSLLSSRQEILSTFVHELVHCLCYRQGLWSKYHSGEDGMMKTAIKAERYVDRWAARLLYDIDKRLRYLGSYTEGSNTEIKKFLENYYHGEEV